MKEFQLQGINHLALVCKDMEITVDFYTKTLGLSLIENIELPGGGKHFFFDIGNGDALAFFYFPNAPEAVPGVASMSLDMFKTGNIVTAHGSMNHVAFSVPVEKLEEYRAKLVDKGIEVTPVVYHGNNSGHGSSSSGSSLFISSCYFFDPNGILLEFASFTSS
jgi:catechol 2,3-dioxygenase-like lactoylglutathione lyase family enzyme